MVILFKNMPGYKVSQIQKYRCNRLRRPLTRLSGLQCFNMGHNGHGINLYGIVMTLMGNLNAGGQSSLGHLSLLHRYVQWLLKFASLFII